MNKGLFITLEGGEGAGKTTLMRRLGSFLESQGKQLLLTREPGGSNLGETIREWLLKKGTNHTVGPKAELLLFLAARAQHLEERIIPALQSGKIVICDRFNDSTVAYQSAARGLEVSLVKELCGFVCESWQPNLTFFLDVDPKIGIKRTLKRENNKAGGGVDRMESESMEFHQKVRQAFIRLAEQEPERMKRLDASLSSDEVFHAAVQYVKQLHI